MRGVDLIPWQNMMLTSNDTVDYRNIEYAIKSIFEAIIHSKHYYEQCKQAHDESKGNPDNNSISLVKRVDETLRKVRSSLSA